MFLSSSSSDRSWQWRAVVAFAVVVACLPCYVAASSTSPNSWGCEDYWKGPSRDNSITDCLANQDRNKQWTSWFWVPALPFAILAFLILCYPVIFICRQACNMCGGRRRQPGVCCRCEPMDEATGRLWVDVTQEEKNNRYSRCDHACVKVPAFLFCILSVGVIIVVIRGASESEKAASALRTDLETMTVDPLSVQLQKLTVFIENAGVSVSELQPVSAVVTKFKDYLRMYDDDYESYITNGIRIGMNVLGVMPFVFTLLMPCYASFDRCRQFWPWCTSCIYFFWGVVFSALGGLFLFMAVILSTGCGEIKRQDLRMPGIMQWYVKPFCENLNQFGPMVDTFTSFETQRAQSFCSTVGTYCNNGVALAVNDAFDCTAAFDADPASFCVTYAASVTATASIALKSSSTWCAAGTKYLEVTSTTCPNMPSADLDAITTSITQQSQAQNLRRAVNETTKSTQDLTDCNYLLDLGCGAVRRGCPYLRNAGWMIGFGCFFASVLFTGGIFVMFRGQKVFYKSKSAANAPDDDARK